MGRYGFIVGGMVVVRGQGDFSLYKGNFISTKRFNLHSNRFSSEIRFEGISRSPKLKYFTP